MTLPMALVDFIPVVLFFLATCLIMHDIYHMASKGAFSLIAAGFILVSVAGFYKALWKLLYALEICDFVKLNETFFPMQSTGFILAGIGMTALFLFPQKEKQVLASAAVPVYTSSLLFVIFTILGDAGIYVSLMRISAKLHKKAVIIPLLISFLLMLGMGYLSSRDFTEPVWNWIGEAVNIVGQLLFLASAVLLHKAGLEKLEMK
jgi:hypothetical protein